MKHVARIVIGILLCLVAFVLLLVVSVLNVLLAGWWQAVWLVVFILCCSYAIGALLNVGTSPAERAAEVTWRNFRLWMGGL